MSECYDNLFGGHVSYVIAMITRARKRTLYQIDQHYDNADLFITRWFGVASQPYNDKELIEPGSSALPSPDYNNE